MSAKAKLYIAAIILLGAVAALHCLVHWEFNEPLRFCAYLLIALPASGLKVRLPGITGTLSVSFFFILVGLLELSLPQTLALAWSSVLVQQLWHSRCRPMVAQALFNVGNISVATVAAHHLIYSETLRAQGLDEPLLVVLAVSVYFLLNTFAVATVVALTEAKSARKVWWESYFWSYPSYLVGAALAGVFHLATRYMGWQTALLILPTVYLIHRSYRLYLERMEREKAHAEEMAALHLRTVEALALAIEAKDHHTHDHLERVRVYAVELGRELGLSEFELDALRAAALLHDIGKLAVPEHIVSKPGRLTPEEFERMKIHPTVGAEILERVRFPYPVAPIVAAHHEKWDGTGYPNGLAGEGIPLGARILSAVDCLDALASDRHYRPALPLDEAIKVVFAESGKAFDPRVVELLERRFVELEQLAREAQAARGRLSTDLRIERGAAPAAGFESAGRAASQREPMDFAGSIAAARREVQILFELSRDPGHALSLDQTFSLLAMRLWKVIPYNALAVWLCRRNDLAPGFVTGDDARLFSSLSIPLGQGLSGWVAEQRRPILNGNPSVECGYLNDPTKFSALRSALAMPLEGLKGVAGVLTLYHAERDAFSRDHMRILLAISSKLAIAIDNGLKSAHPPDTAPTDALTELPNAPTFIRYLEREVARCRASGETLTVLMCNLDGFATINDRFGHLEGDRLLRLVAAGLRKVCRDSDFVARVGGDEFAIVLANPAPRAVPDMMDRFREVVRLAGWELCGEEALSLSVGQATMPEDGRAVEQLMAEADRRMYQAKCNRRHPPTDSKAVASLLEALVQ